jgi:hypothetical protein
MATPPAPQNSSLWKISLPQIDGPGERVERIAQLEIAQLGYSYDPNNTSLPMPMGTDEAAGIEFGGGWWNREDVAPAKKWDIELIP